MNDEIKQPTIGQLHDSLATSGEPILLRYRGVMFQVWHPEACCDGKPEPSTAPRLTDLVGLDPDYIDGEDPVEYVRRIRGSAISDREPEGEAPA